MRRVHIPKGSGNETRPIGIPSFEDKVLQRAVVMLLEPIYEEDFHEGSYGFRPRRSSHQALEALWKCSMNVAGGWILEVDIRKFFDTIDHAHLRDFLRHRVRDGVLTRLIGKWLNAGVMEVIPKRFEKYGLTVHPEKTRLVDFRRSSRHRNHRVDASGDPKPETFDLLGFTHYWTTNYKGKLIIRRKTMKKRLARAIRTVRQWCRKFGPYYARKLRRRQGRLGDTWHLDELFVHLGECLVHAMDG